MSDELWHPEAVKIVTAGDTEAKSDSDRFFDEEIAAGRILLRAGVIRYTGNVVAGVTYASRDYVYGEMIGRSGVPRIHMRRRAKRYTTTWGRLQVRLTTGVWTDHEKVQIHRAPLTGALFVKPLKKEPENE